MSQTNDGLPPEAAKAERLLYACQKYRDAKLMKEYEAADKRLKHEGKWVYEISDDGEQINTPNDFDGFTQHLIKEKQAIVDKMTTNFIGLLFYGHLTAWARENSPLAPWREIPASAWATLRLKNIAKDIVEGPGILLYDVRIGPRVNLPAPLPVPEKPPAPVSPPVVEPPATLDLPRHVKKRPGRPTEMPIVEQEFERRCKAGKCEDSFRSEAFYLESWFIKNFPDKDGPKAQTIRNTISELWKTFPNEIKEACPQLFYQAQF